MQALENAVIDEANLKNVHKFIRRHKGDSNWRMHDLLSLMINEEDTNEKSHKDYLKIGVQNLN